MLQAFEDIYLGREVVFEFLVQFGQVDGLNGDVRARFLWSLRNISMDFSISKATGNRSLSASSPVETRGIDSVPQVSSPRI